MELKNALVISGFLSISGLSIADVVEADDSRWCFKYEVRSNHPLSWQTMENELKPYIENDQFEIAYWKVLKAYGEIYGYKNDNYTKFKAELSEFLNQRRDDIVEGGRKGEQPRKWSAVTAGNNTVHLYGFRFVDQWHSLSCDSPEWTQNSSGDVGLFYAAEVIREIASTDLAAAQNISEGVSLNAKTKLKNWLYNGLPMWPWEHSFNSPENTGSLAAEPTGRQWIFARPSLALVVNPENEWESELDHALNVEFGHVWYLDKVKFDKWVGVSAFTSFTDDAGQGYGLMVRYNNYTIGAAHHESINDNLIYLSIDLTQFITDHWEKAELLRRYTTSD